VTRFRYAPDALERIGYQGDVRRSLAAPVAALALPFYLTAFRRAVRRAVREFEPDLIHAHWWIPGGWAAVGQGRPVVISCHGSDVRLLLGSAPLRILARRTFRRASRVTAVSALMRDDLAAVAPALRERLTTAYLPVDVDRFTLPSARADVTPRILYAGNLIAAKGVDLILRAYARLLSAGVACTLRVVGDGVERASLGQLADSLGIGPMVEWGGTRTPVEMPAEYAAATVTVMASRGPRGEGLPMTVVEALLAGSGVVATPAGGTSEVVRDGETGLLARDGDAADLARQLGRMLGDPALRRATVAAGQAYCRRVFAPGPAMDRFFAIYEAALAAHP
jgi:glycosyltransferase involved in cell wall biosynthesis